MPYCLAYNPFLLLIAYLKNKLISLLEIRLVNLVDIYFLPVFAFLFPYSYLALLSLIKTFLLRIGILKLSLFHLSPTFHIGYVNYKLQERTTLLINERDFGDGT